MMAVYDLEEQEQISELKAWWAQYGNFVVTLAVVAALASVGWQGYRRVQQTSSTSIWSEMRRVRGFIHGNNEKLLSFE